MTSLTPTQTCRTTPPKLRVTVFTNREDSYKKFKPLQRFKLICEFLIKLRVIIKIAECLEGDKLPGDNVNVAKKSQLGLSTFW